ncbi:MAG: hypothetical protein AAGD13_20575 [Pseudomonadota bacterium]
MQDLEGYTGQQARLLTAESQLKRNGELAHEIAKEIASKLHGFAAKLPGRSAAFLRQSDSGQEYDVRYRVGIERTFRSGLLRSFRYKLLQIHLHGNFQSVIASVSAPEGHPFADGLVVSDAERAEKIFSAAYLASLLPEQVRLSEEAFQMWKEDGSAFGFLRNGS